MDIRRSRITIEITAETSGLSEAEHEKRVRWLYRNAVGTNSDLADVFFVAVVRDADGNLLEFTGAGRGSPSPEIGRIIEALTREQART
jgi:hypothetical protein